VTTQTLRAFTEAEYCKIVGSLYQRKRNRAPPGCTASLTTRLKSKRAVGVQVLRDLWRGLLLHNIFVVSAGAIWRYHCGRCVRYTPLRPE
jgi:hypothetical protein